jgi:1-aminocyclopropane-1-carboxylate deaminase/D-cysteine desulfhydrase-like pyridoxal-dependent ACC family enzyme
LTSRQGLGVSPAHVVVAADRRRTLASLLAGGVGGRVSSPASISDRKAFPASVAHLASEVCAHLGEPRAFTPTDVPLIEATYVGEAYGRPSEPGNAALERLLRAEGILLDPVYTAKAVAGLLGEAAGGRLGTGEPVVFVHTGGLPALFA